LKNKTRQSGLHLGILRVFGMAEEVIFRIIKGSLTGEEFVFDEKGLCLIGRSADCALQIPKEKDMKISRRHCLLILDPPNVRIRDLGSRNGTTVNGELLQAGVITDEPEKMAAVDKILKDGDIISIGETGLTLAIPSESTQIEEIPQTKPHTSSHKLPAATKVIKLSKPSATKTGTVIPKSTPVNSGFFAPPAPPSTSSRTIAMTEAISRETMKKREHTDTLLKQALSKDPQTPKSKILSPHEHAAKPAESTQVNVPEDKTENSKGQITAVIPVSTPPSPPATPPKKAAIILGKKKDKVDSVANSDPKGQKPKKILKAKIVTPGSTAARKTPKKLNSHMGTVVMNTHEVENLPDDTSLQSESSEIPDKPQKRVTKFKIKGPS